MHKNICIKTWKVSKKEGAENKAVYKVTNLVCRKLYAREGRPFDLKEKLTV